MCLFLAHAQRFHIFNINKVFEKRSIYALGGAGLLETCLVLKFNAGIKHSLMMTSIEIGNKLVLDFAISTKTCMRWCISIVQVITITTCVC